MFDDQRRFVVVRSPQVKGIAIAGLAQRHGASERSEKGHLGNSGQWQSGHAGGSADVAEQGERVVADQLAGVFGASLGLVAIVKIDQFDLAPGNPAQGVDLLEIKLGTTVELDAELRRRASERDGLAQHDAVALGPDGGCAEGRK